MVVYGKKKKKYATASINQEEITLVFKINFFFLQDLLEAAPKHGAVFAS